MLPVRFNMIMHYAFVTQIKRKNNIKMTD